MFVGYGSVAILEGAPQVWEPSRSLSGWAEDLLDGPLPMPSQFQQRSPTGSPTPRDLAECREAKVVSLEIDPYLKGWPRPQPLGALLLCQSQC